MSEEHQADAANAAKRWHMLLKRCTALEANWRAAGIAAMPRLDRYGERAWIEVDERDPDWGPTAHTRVYEAVAALLGVRYDGENHASVHQALSALLCRGGCQDGSGDE